MDSQLNIQTFISILSLIISLITGIAVILATYRGPLVAASQSDERRANAEKISRKMAVFRNLMATRYSFMERDFVTSLNMVYIEFYESENVIKYFMEFMSVMLPNPSLGERVGMARQEALVRLLNAIGEDLGYKMRDLDIMNNSYSPQGWVDEANKKSEIQDFFHNISTERKSFPVSILIPDLVIENGPDGKPSSIRASKEQKL